MHPARVGWPVLSSPASSQEAPVVMSTGMFIFEDQRDTKSLLAVPVLLCLLCNSQGGCGALQGIVV